MKVLVFESNLFWSARLMKSLKALGHEARIVSPNEGGPFEGDVALVNLGAEEYCPVTLVPELKEQGIYVIGHAGHKEKELRELGREAGCQRIASNSEISFKLENLLAEAIGAS